MLSLTSEYALSVMAYLAGQGPGFCKVPVIAKSIGLSEPYAFKVVTALEHAGLVTTFRGRNGGTKLSGSPKTISLMDVVNAVGSLKRSAPMPKGSVGASFAPLNRKLDAIIGDLEKRLSTTTLGDVAPPASR
jgi:Rrf2 family protein